MATQAPKLSVASYSDTWAWISFYPSDYYTQLQTTHDISSGGYNTITTDGGTDTHHMYVQITGLKPWTKYYIWGRGYLASTGGWSPYSSPSIGVTTEGPPFAPSLTFDNIKETAVDISLTAGYSAKTIDQHQIGYSLTDVATPTTIVTYTANTGTDSAGITKTLASLNPGTTYYIKGRSHDSYGWGDWSSSVKLTTLYGVWLLQGTTWKHAIAWVNVTGTWKRARVLVKDDAQWKECR